MMKMGKKSLNYLFSIITTTEVSRFISKPREKRRFLKIYPILLRSQLNNWSAGERLEKNVESQRWTENRKQNSTFWWGRQPPTGRINGWLYLTVGGGFLCRLVAKPLRRPHKSKWKCRHFSVSVVLLTAKFSPSSSLGLGNDPERHYSHITSVPLAMQSPCRRVG